MCFEGSCSITGRRWHLLYLYSFPSTSTTYDRLALHSLTLPHQFCHVLFVFVVVPLSLVLREQVLCWFLAVFLSHAFPCELGLDAGCCCWFPQFSTVWMSDWTRVFVQVNTWSCLGSCCKCSAGLSRNLFQLSLLYPVLFFSTRDGNNYFLWPNDLNLSAKEITKPKLSEFT